MKEPEPYPQTRLRAPVIRSRIMLEIASDLVGQEGWAEKQALVQLRVQGSDDFTVGLLGGDSPKSLLDVAEGRIDVAIINPATAANAGMHRLGLDPALLASIATVPSYDQLGLAVATAWGVSTLEELAAARPPLRISLRDQTDHAVNLFIHDALAAVGVTLDDVVSWGGSLTYDPGLPHLPARAARIEDGTVDAVFDEGVYNWAGLASDNGIRFLGFGDEALARLESQGYRRGTLTRARFPELEADVTTLDFSGFMIYTRRDAPGALVEGVCRALAARSSSIAWQGGDALPLEHMVIDAVDAPLAVPLHPAAERFWASRS